MDEYTEYKQILELWEQGKSKVDIARILGITRYRVTRCLEHFRSVAQLDEEVKSTDEQRSIQTKRNYIIPRYRPQQRRYTTEELGEAVANSLSIAETLRKLGLRPAGGNYVIIKKKIKQAEIDTSHFRGQGWLKGKQNLNTPKRATKEILVKDSTYGDSTSQLRNRLIVENYFEHRCASCELTEWMEQPIPLELDHINGDRHGQPDRKSAATLSELPRPHPDLSRQKI